MGIVKMKKIVEEWHKNLSRLIIAITIISVALVLVVLYGWNCFHTLSLYYMRERKWSEASSTLPRERMTWDNGKFIASNHKIFKMVYHKKQWKDPLSFRSVQVQQLWIVRASESSFILLYVTLTTIIQCTPTIKAHNIMYNLYVSHDEEGRRRGNMYGVWLLESWRASREPKVHIYKIFFCKKLFLEVMCKEKI